MLAYPKEEQVNKACEVGQAKAVFLILDKHDENLQDLINKINTSNFEKEHLLIIFYNLLCSVKFLHSSGHSHKSLKPDNIYVDEECNIKLSNFKKAYTKRTLNE